ncbi:hypothetical protein GPECTOR_21g694 [Gonium pectorale]|uniref:Uncharacterized protein n=1 Tax=Gonium pectorale TaxID=33097 RepID=A0A150GI06_GONPE|nr:hypothetical protein GPECTOR_21g694 [Gonium pectorale]|eukprot:KXZ49468.1 hypothetical protein GPECTOR_21g694 [Gonium pectorale]
MPATFQQLSPQLMCLLDPKKDRLVYLVGVEEGGSVDDSVAQVRALLRAAAAPYLHTLALPDHVNKALLKEFPGGAPIITRVPLPPGCEVERQAVQLEAQGDGDGEQRGGKHDEDLERPSGQQQRRSGVLDLLYGPPELRRPGLPGAHAAGGSVPGLAALEAAAGDTVSPLGPAAGPPTDLPDDVASRPKRTRDLMAWLKGASMPVARRRASRTPYKFDWLVEEFNRLGHVTAFLLTPNLLFVRNSIMETLATDYQEQMVQQHLATSGVVMGMEMPDGLEGEDEDEEDGGDGEAVELPVVVLEGDEATDLESLLKAIGMIDSDSDDDDDEDDEAVGADEDEEAGVEENDDEDGSGDLPPEIISVPLLPIVTPGGLSGPQALGGSELPPPPSGVLHVTDSGSDGDAGDLPFSMDLIMSQGPMGWTVTMRHRPDGGSGAGGDGGFRPGLGGAEPVEAQAGKPAWGRVGPGAASAPGGGVGGAGGSANAGGSGSRPDATSSQPMLPPEAAGYAAMDMEQLAEFVLGRNASPEEMREFARAVAQSAEVEEVFGSGASQPVGGGAGVMDFGRWDWVRPGTPPPSLREQLARATGARRGAVTPRRHRLRIPDRVLSLATRQTAAAAEAEAAARRQEPSEGVAARDGEGGNPHSGDGGSGGRHAGAATTVGRGRHSAGPPALTLRRPGGRRGVEVVEVTSRSRTRPAAAAPPSPSARESSGELVEAAVDALHAAPRAAREAVEGLMAFLRGRPTGQPAGGAAVASGGAEPLLGRRSRRGHVGLACGRDAVVVLPVGLMRAVAGAWQQEEERLMHPDLLHGRRG